MNYTTFKTSRVEYRAKGEATFSVRYRFSIHVGGLKVADGSTLYRTENGAANAAKRIVSRMRVGPTYLKREYMTRVARGVLLSPGMP